MIAWIILAAYGTGYALTWRTVVWAVLNDVTYGTPDGTDVFMSMALGSIMTLVWPGIAALMVLKRLVRADDTASLLMPRAVRREHKLREQKERIRQLEYETGIRSRSW